MGWSIACLKTNCMIVHDLDANRFLLRQWSLFSYWSITHIDENIMKRHWQLSQAGQFGGDIFLNEIMRNYFCSRGSAFE